MASKKRRKHPGVAWRVLFGQHGPTKKSLKKAASDIFGPKTIASIAHDPKTGKLVTKNLVVDKRTGQITTAPKPPARSKAAKKTATSRASKPSKPSRAGQVQRRTAAPPAIAQPRQLPESQSMTERALRNPDGTLAGSKKDPRKAALEYQRIMQRVAELERRTDRDLGWDKGV